MEASVRADPEQEAEARIRPSAMVDHQAFEVLLVDRRLRVLVSRNNNRDSRSLLRPSSALSPRKHFRRSLASRPHTRQSYPHAHRSLIDLSPSQVVTNYSLFLKPMDYLKTGTHKIGSVTRQDGRTPVERIAEIEADPRYKEASIPGLAALVLIRNLRFGNKSLVSPYPSFAPQSLMTAL